jgi:hypothetical protein
MRFWLVVNYETPRFAALPGFCLSLRKILQSQMSWVERRKHRHQRFTAHMENSQGGLSHSAAAMAKQLAHDTGGALGVGIGLGGGRSTNLGIGLIQIDFNDAIAADAVTRRWRG